MYATDTVVRSRYEPDAQLLGEDGAVAVGLVAVHEVWRTLVSFDGRLSMTTRYSIEQGDIALLSNLRRFELGGAETATALTAEVARRQADGSGRYVIDNPYAAPA